MDQSRIYSHHRAKDGKIAKKHGNSTIRSLRDTYGDNFAVGEDDNASLSVVLPNLDELSLSKLVDDAK